MSAALWGMLAGAGLNMYQERKRAKETKKWNALQSEMQQYAGLTGKEGELSPGGEADYLGAGMQGALGGMRAGQEIGGALDTKGTPEATAHVFGGNVPSQSFSEGSSEFVGGSSPLKSKYSMMEGF